MPAHDEELVIAYSVTSLLPQLRVGDRLLVIADNCTDATAQLAAAAGAEVTERHDSSRRGKGFALDWGIRELQADPPDAVLIIDADCQVDAGSLQRLSELCTSAGRPAQSSNLMGLPDNPSLKLRVGAFAWLLKTQMRAYGYHRLGLPCQLMGTGMAFPWALIRDAPLASSNIVEDVQLGVDLAINGRAAVFCPQAVVRSSFPSSPSAATSQRQRWEQGHLSTLGTQVPRLLRASWRYRRPQLAAIAWDLSVPPVALLVLLQALTLAASAAAWWIYGSSAGVVLSLLGVGVLFAVIAIAWQRLGRQVISLGQLFSVPLYVVAKLPMYFAMFAGKKQRRWVRTDRDDRRP